MERTAVLVLALALVIVTVLTLNSYECNNRRRILTEVPNVNLPEPSRDLPGTFASSLNLLETDPRGPEPREGPRNTGRAPPGTLGNSMEQRNDVMLGKCWQLFYVNRF